MYTEFTNIVQNGKDISPNGYYYEWALGEVFRRGKAYDMGQLAIYVDDPYNGGYDIVTIDFFPNSEGGFTAYDVSGRRYLNFRSVDAVIEYFDPCNPYHNGGF